MANSIASDREEVQAVPPTVQSPASQKGVRIGQHTAEQDVGTAAQGDHAQVGERAIDILRIGLGLSVEGDGLQEEGTGLVGLACPDQRVARPAEVVDVRGCVVLFQGQLSRSAEQCHRLVVQPGLVGIVAQRREEPWIFRRGDHGGVATQARFICW